MLKRISKAFSNFVGNEIAYFFTMLTLFFILSMCSNILGYILVITFFIN